jgi:hypothetical protein
MHEPWRHRSSFDPYAGVIPRMATHHNADLFWFCGHWPRHSLIRCRGDFGEEPLDEIEPGAGRRREVRDKAFVSC